MAYKINPDECKGCEECLNTCPMEAITKEGNVCVINEDVCVSCGSCEAACEYGAIESDD